MSNNYRVPAMTLPPAVMRDIRKESNRSGQTVTAVVRARIVKEYEKRIAKDKSMMTETGRELAAGKAAE